ncbi:MULTISPECIES: glycosyltransferase [Halocynthiibacter]|uniref:Glycosyltransferase n=1 Tax=Halocynthiibacter halioticoli TaxID=2986804 RepID=A0AAE3J0X9_9RHOB|nr:MULTISPECIES: glycosyltransferase [Halocynthiibacter]MCV6825654.1 glycosyltransferase [Halocynthiibacter halioticoli]MCW4058655.1 glycosyltransferase [Halocynthiibacter sp. SDUM655004]
MKIEKIDLITKPYGGTDREYPLCAVLLAVCDPKEYLDEQLESLGHQMDVEIDLYLSDDSENFRQLNAKCKVLSPKVFRGPKRGFAQNFRFLLEQVERNAEYAAFCDQDDVWDNDKLVRAVRALEEVPTGKPAVYCSRTIECDEGLRPLGVSRLPKRPLGFSHALVQNVMAGNTMVLNRAALEVLQDASRRIDRVPAHDWWVYQLISGCGGMLLFDPEPSLKYRQHRGNVLGANRGIRAAFGRIRHVFGGVYAGWIDANIAALSETEDFLTPQNRHKLHLFKTARKAWLIPRLLGYWKIGIYRQNSAETLALWIAAALGRV